VCHLLACFLHQSAPVGHRCKNGTGVTGKASAWRRHERPVCTAVRAHVGWRAPPDVTARGLRRANAPVHWLNTTLFISRPPSGAPSARAARSTSTSLATLALSTAPAAAPGSACGARAPANQRAPLAAARHGRERAAPVCWRQSSSAPAPNTQREMKDVPEPSCIRSEPQMPGRPDSAAGSTPLPRSPRMPAGCLATATS